MWRFARGKQFYASKQTSNKWIYEERKGEPDYWKKRMLSLCREIVFLSMINSPHVIKQEEVIRTETNYYSILEYANGGSLQSLLNLRERFSEKVAKQCIKEIIAGCSALYAMNVIHRDLKLDNVLIHFPNRIAVTKEQLAKIDLETEPFIVKIADLGYAREFSKKGDERIQSFKGSPLMMAPEQLITYWGRGSGYTHKIDVWAVGVILYQMLTGMFIFTIDRGT